jgi:CheY-like chemotaxis protein
VWSQGCRVLVAEDNVINQKVTAKMLRKSGAFVGVVSDGREAVEAVLATADGSSRYDVVLMDMVMPQMGGVEATKVSVYGLGSRF